MKLDIRKQRGAISLFALLSMLFFLIFLLGVFTTISNRNRTQVQTLTEIKEIYNKDAKLIYWLKIAPEDTIIPIYTKEQLKLINEGTDTYVEINERIYKISEKSIDDCEVKVPIYIYESDNNILKSYIGKDGMVIKIDSSTDDNEPCITDKWYGTIATSFQSGIGTETNPYLITSGEELAYLANQVNAGTNNYSGKYFKLACCIDLDGRQWTPIGNYNGNSFQGVFDGAGHTISNAIITTKAANTANVESYGLFGSIGMGTTNTEIRNLEINNFTIKLGIATATFTASSGYNAGFVVGTIYDNAKVVNCAVRDSNMVTKNASETDITLTTANTVEVFLGGIAGSVGRRSTTTNRNGVNYAIDNCYVSANIRVMLTSTPANSLYVSSGGIVGRIHRQAAWPKNCFYKGTIHTNSSTNTAANGGYIGPIFGSLVNSTTPVNPNSSANQNTCNNIWSGTEAGAGLTMTSYYTEYTAKATTFNSSHTTGTVPTSNTPPHRITTLPNNSTASMAYYQGVNKGIYIVNNDTNMNSTILSMFNNNTTGNYVQWKYENDDFTIHR